MGIVDELIKLTQVVSDLSTISPTGALIIPLVLALLVTWGVGSILKTVAKFFKKEDSTSDAIDVLKIALDHVQANRRYSDRETRALFEMATDLMHDMIDQNQRWKNQQDSQDETGNEGQEETE